jgi:hypothetical protein
VVSSFGCCETRLIEALFLNGVWPKWTPAKWRWLVDISHTILRAIRLDTNDVVVRNAKPCFFDPAIEDQLSIRLCPDE